MNQRSKKHINLDIDCAYSTKATVLGWPPNFFDIFKVPRIEKKREEPGPERRPRTPKFQTLEDGLIWFTDPIKETRSNAPQRSWRALQVPKGTQSAYKIENNQHISQKILDTKQFIFREKLFEFFKLLRMNFSVFQKRRKNCICLITLYAF